MNIEHPNEVYQFVLEGLGNVIGIPIVDVDKGFMGIKNLRIIKPMQDGTRVYIPLAGFPEEVFIGKIPIVYYLSKDRDILKEYQESVSGITVTNQMPNPKPFSPILVK
jgi:hypothetical protein